jgi:hypothetical protein
VIKLQMGKGRRGITPCGGCSTVELPRKIPGIGLEPTTRDNPQLRPIKLEADKKAIVELPGVLPLHHCGMVRGAELNRHCRVPITHNLRPAKKTGG